VPGRIDVRRGRAVVSIAGGTRSREQTPAEEFANSLTHGVGFGLSLACLVILVVFSALRGGAFLVVSCSVYGATLALLYLSSTLYHSVRSPWAKRVFNVIDHSSIYLLVAGTYTPYTLVPLRGEGGWILFGLVWGIAAAGIVYQALFIHRFRILSVASYLAMGWLVVFAMKPLLRTLSTAGVAWLAAGGLFYTAGVVFYAWKRPYFHAVWHLFVLAGSLCHFFSILFYVVL
jgi:hemolysin III